MDSRNNFLSVFKNWIEGIDDDFLIGISNKGIFNRASRELEEIPEISVNIDDKIVTCTLPDGNICSFTTDIKKFKCSCPSRSICKHVIISLINIRKNKSTLLCQLITSVDGEADEEPSGNDTFGKEETSQEAFIQVLSITSSELIKLGGERAYQEALFRIEFGIAHEIQEGTMLSVKFIDEGIAVRFPGSEPIRDAICTCKAAAFCRHRVEAVVLFQLYKKKNDLLQFNEGNSVEKPKETILEVKKFVGELIISGLSRLPESCVETMEQMSVICHFSSLPVLERLFRKLKTETELYYNKHAGFSRKRMMNIIVTIYNLCLAIENTENDSYYLKELIGEHKSSYYDIPPIELCGMGAESWTSDSGFEGLTFYFYYEQGKKWFTYTNARPVYYEGIKVNASRMYKANPPWGLEGSLEEFSKSCIKLFGGKANREGRLSSSEESQASISKKTDIHKIDLEEFIYSDWTEMLEKLQTNFEYSLLVRKENSTIALLKVHQWGKCAFDNVNQIFNLPIYDDKDKKLEIALRYSEKNKYLIEKLEYMERIENLPCVILGSVYLLEEQFCVKPITAWFVDGRVTNLTLD